MKQKLDALNDSLSHEISSWEGKKEGAFWRALTVRTAISFS